MAKRRHGHVVPRPDGTLYRCGGPRMCTACAHERRQVNAVAEALHQQCRDDWAELEKIDPGGVRTYHGYDAHTPAARRVLLRLDAVDTDADTDAAGGSDG
ncbi:MAG: hypothetical protein ACRDRZ_03670 [Pseudonocardiaceae bacterium]